MMELVDMNSLGLFDFKSYPFKSDLPYNNYYPFFLNLLRIITLYKHIDMSWTNR